MSGLCSGKPTPQNPPHKARYSTSILGTWNSWWMNTTANTCHLMAVLYKKRSTLASIGAFWRLIFSHKKKQQTSTQEWYTQKKTNGKDKNRELMVSRWCFFFFRGGFFLPDVPRFAPLNFGWNFWWFTQWPNLHLELPNLTKQIRKSPNVLCLPPNLCWSLQKHC